MHPGYRWAFGLLLLAFRAAGRVTCPPQTAQDGASVSSILNGFYSYNCDGTLYLKAGRVYTVTQSVRVQSSITIITAPDRTNPGGAPNPAIINGTARPLLYVDTSGSLSLRNVSFRGSPAWSQTVVQLVFSTLLIEDCSFSGYGQVRYTAPILSLRDPTAVTLTRVSITDNSMPVGAANFMYAAITTPRAEAFVITECRIARNYVQVTTQVTWCRIQRHISPLSCASCLFPTLFKHGQTPIRS
jgi:hypothetical protein